MKQEITRIQIGSIAADNERDMETIVRFQRSHKYHLYRDISISSLLRLNQVLKTYYTVIKISKYGPVVHVYNGVYV